MICCCSRMTCSHIVPCIVESLWYSDEQPIQETWSGLTWNNVYRLWSETWEYQHLSHIHFIKIYIMIYLNDVTLSGNFIWTYKKEKEFSWDDCRVFTPIKDIWGWWGKLKEQNNHVSFSRAPDTCWVKNIFIWGSYIINQKTKAFIVWYAKAL